MRAGGPNNRRPRGRHHGDNNNRNNNNGPSSNNMGGGMNRPRSASSLRHQTFDSNGPDVRVRGNAWQVYEKYQTLARDAVSGGDKVLAESYLQHAEHYFRIIEAINEATTAEQRAHGGPQAFDQQPNVPPNYFGPDGTPSLTVPSSPSSQPGAEQPSMAQAEVQPRNQPSAPPPFFATDENEEPSSGPEQLVANR